MNNRIKAILLDLDGTLIDLDWRSNMKGYYKRMKKILKEMNMPITYFYALRWAAKKMITDEMDGMLNIDRYFKYLSKKSGVEDKVNRELYYKFYEDSFSDFRDGAVAKEHAHELFNELKKLRKKFVLATNPVFPISAVEERLNWGNYDMEDFDLVSHVHNFHYCKPNPKYFIEVAEKMECRTDECFMIGDDYKFDIKPSLEVGCKAWWYIPRAAMKKRRGVISGGHLALIDAIKSKSLSKILS